MSKGKKVSLLFLSCAFVFVAIFSNNAIIVQCMLCYFVQCMLCYYVTGYCLTSISDDCTVFCLFHGPVVLAADCPSQPIS